MNDPKVNQNGYDVEGSYDVPTMRDGHCDPAEEGNWSYEQEVPGIDDQDRD